MRSDRNEQACLRLTSIYSFIVCSLFVLHGRDFKNVDFEPKVHGFESRSSTFFRQVFFFLLFVLQLFRSLFLYRFIFKLVTLLFFEFYSMINRLIFQSFSVFMLFSYFFLFTMNFLKVSKDFRCLTFSCEYYDHIFVSIYFYWIY